MLYVTTRNNTDAVTPQRVLAGGRGVDGGLYVPFHSLTFTESDLDAMAAMPFGQCVAEVLNRLFRTQLTSWDVDFCIGRRPVRLVTLRQKIIMGECWHNPEWDLEFLIRSLVRRIDGETGASGSWMVIGVRIALLFGIFGELRSKGIRCADVSCVSGEFTAPISAWYARQWGLPIGNIVCCCNENKNLWDLICQGQMRTDTVSLQTVIPEADVVLPADLERLIHACGGQEEAVRFADACTKGGLYAVDEQLLAEMRKGLYVSVASTQRVLHTIPGVYAAYGYIQAPGSALAYAGLQYYRAKTGQTRPAVILAETGPARSSGLVAEALGISEQELLDRI